MFFIKHHASIVLRPSALLTALCISSLAACSSDSGDGNQQDAEPTPTEYEISGLAQKGPFVNGTAVDAAELDTGLVQTGRRFSTTIADDSGAFSINQVSLASPFVRLAADGFYFDEVSGNVSDSRLELLTYADISAGTDLNVNLLGHLEAARIEYLVQESGLAFADAKAQAHEEVLAIFTFDDADVAASEALDIASSGAGNAKLLAISVMLQGYRSVGELSELLANIRTDIRTDGVLSSQTSGSALMNAAAHADRATVRENLVARYEALGTTATIPDFESELQAFITDAGYPVTEVVDYPATAMYGAGQTADNVLVADAIAFTTGVAYSFAADVPAGFPLRIRITQSPQDIGTGDLWYFTPNLNTHWDYNTLDTATGVQELTTNEPGLATMEFGFSGTGAAVVEYFEFGATTPTRTKNITWAP